MSVPSTSRKKTVLVLAAASIPLLVALLMLAATLLGSRRVQEVIVSQLTERVQRKITYSQANISFTPAPSFTFHDVDIRERDGERSFLSARRLTFHLSLTSLVRGDIVLGSISLDEPRIAIIREQDGTFNVADLLTQTGDTDTVKIRSLRLKHGTVTFRDNSTSPLPPPLTFEKMDVSLSNPARGKISRFKLATTVRVEGKASAVSAAGSVRIAPEGSPLQESSLDLDLAALHLDMGVFWPYYRHLVPFRQLRGEVDVTASLKGRLDRLAIRGDCGVKGGYLDYSSAFEDAVSFPPFHLTWNLETSPDRVNIASIDLSSPLASVKGSCDISGIGTGDPHIKATATMPPFRLGPARHLIPYPIIARDVADFIREHIKDGTFSLTQGRLDGRVSQIAHMEQGENYNVLAISATCTSGLLTFGDSVPSFNNVSGTLELKGKDFLLRGMKGQFGTSPFSLEGSIRDYPLHKPSSYPFSMTMTPRQPEVAWLTGDKKNPLLTLDGPSSLTLSGDGHSSAYSLNGKWDLSGSRYALKNILNKPTGLPNTLAFSSILSPEGVRIPSIVFALPPLTLSGAANFRHAGEKPLTFSVKCPPVLLQNIRTLFPSLTPFQPAGHLQGAVTGEARSLSLSDLKLSGEAVLKDVSFKPHAAINPLTSISGTIMLRGDLLETGQLTATMGSSTIQGKGSLKGFSTPEFSASFKSRRIDPRDLGLQSSLAEDVILRRVTGSISFQDGVVAIKRLGATVNDTTLKAAGSLRLKPQTVYDLTVTAPSLDSRDVMLLASLQKAGATGRSPSSISGRLQVSAETGMFQKVPFRKLQGTLNQEGSIIYIQPLECQILNGKADGKMRIDRTNPASPRYQASYNLERISAEQLYTLVGNPTRLITGTLSVHGELTARGSTQQELRRTALGNTRFRFEEGVIRKFPLLSKIFSLLNVSQLLKLQLPDMARDGMPYNTITGTVSVKDGIISTSDLKVDSDAMNISAVGSADMVKEELNLTVGVKPLQTVDKVVSKIPLVGWVLTGKDKTLLTAWFEAKGTWSDPQVSAIPISSISKGVLGIFRRLLELPAKIVTDTGEMVLGN